jgi:iron-sulfur cluster repair protein YtfE (RIC family)
LPEWDNGSINPRGNRMSAIAHYLEQDHQHCDDLYLQAEAHLAEHRLTEGAPAFQRFMLAFELHLAREEQWLFPALEQHLGSSNGPTVVMRNEHQQMRAILRQMQNALEHRDSASFCDFADHLRMLMRQHNLKEENVLYPMAERLLVGSSEAMLRQLMQTDLLAQPLSTGVPA